MLPRPSLTVDAPPRPTMTGCDREPTTRRGETSVLASVEREGFALMSGFGVERFGALGDEGREEREDAAVSRRSKPSRGAQFGSRLIELGRR